MESPPSHGADVSDQDTIPGRILALWREQPERVFCTFVDDETPVIVSYDRLARRAAAFARHYRQIGIGPGDIVLLVLHHTADAAPAFLGAMLLGALPSFMAPLTVKQDPLHYWQGMGQLLARVGGRLLLTFAAYREHAEAALPDLTVPVLAVEDVTGWDDPDAIAEPVSAAAPAFLQHSSGTTGQKKGVVLSHRAVLRQIDSYAETLGLGAADVVACWLPLYHDMGLNACLMPALVKGVPMVAMDPLTWVLRPSLLLDAVERLRCTLLWQPNFAFHHLIRALPEGRRWDLSSLRAVINCSEPCKPATFDLFRTAVSRHGLRADALQVSYAMAENVFAVTQTEPGRPVRIDAVDRAALAAESRALPADDGENTLSFLSCGRPIAGVRLRILGAQAKDLPERHVGEIAIASDHLFQGYFRQPDETARKLRNGWYHSGDLGYLADGELYVTGRKDDLLIIYGRNHYAHDIEFVVNQVDGVCPGRCVALGIDNPDSGSQEVVVVVESDAAAEPGNDLAAKTLARAVKQRVLAQSGLMVAAVRVVPRGWLIKTSSGKISRTENLRRHQAQGHKDQEMGR